jgi:hypothetical protein
MMGTMRRSAVSPPSSSQNVYARTPVANAAPMRAATTRRKSSLAERVRTFFDRTLDAAFGRFDL